MKQKLETWNLKRETFLSFLKKHYFLLILVGCIGFVGLTAFYKIFISKPTYIYAKVKVGQGLWWATTQKPSSWYVQAIQNAGEQHDLIGTAKATLLNTVYYPSWTNGQYDVYTTLRLKVSKGASGYIFNRETIGVSTPIDLEFPTVQFSGTVVALGRQPFHEQYEDKIVYLSKKYAYPWEYDQIQIGDSFSNGQDTIFKLLDKAKGETNEVLFNDQGKLISSETETYRYIIVKAKIKVKKAGGEYIFGEEYSLTPGRNIPLVTNNLSYNDYIITKVD